MRKRSSQRSSRCLSIGPMQPFATSIAASLASCAIMHISIDNSVSPIYDALIGCDQIAETRLRAYGADQYLKHVQAHKVRVCSGVGLH